MKLIITDLDNTLLKKDKTVSEYTVKVLKECQDKGYLIAFATARAENAMTRFIKAITPDVIISNGGATIRVKGKIIYRNLMSSNDVETVIKMSRTFTKGKGLITVESDEGYFCNFEPDDPDRRAAFTYSDFENFNASTYKISAELYEDGQGEAIVNACENCTVIKFTGEKWHRFAAKNSDKETALQMLMDHIGLESIDIIAFGDDLNDLGMLKLAGTAVAVSNSIDEIKAVADHITGSCDNDGVAHYLEKIILK